MVDSVLLRSLIFYVINNFALHLSRRFRIYFWMGDLMVVDHSWRGLEVYLFSSSDRGVFFGLSLGHNF